MDQFPSGTVTLLFADIEGSTRLVRELGEGYGAVLLEFRRLVRGVVAADGGYEVDCRADEFFAAFGRARDGVAAAVAVQRALTVHPWPEGAPLRVRIGLHAGEPAVEGGGYVGLDVNRAARVCAAGHGGQILLSQTVRDLVADHADVKDLGLHLLAGLPGPERIFQLLAPGLGMVFPPLRVQPAEGRRLRGLRPRLRSRPPSLGDSAWQARALLPRVAEPLQTPLSQLAASLFTADRAAVGADGFLARVDRDRLARRLASQRDMAVASPRAGTEAEALEAQLKRVDHLVDRRQALAHRATELPAELDESLTNTKIGSLHERVEAATSELDDALTSAAAALDPLSFRLDRTRHRGVYRSGRKYVVPFVDELGGDRHREFDTLAQARDFRAAIRIAQKAQTDYTGPSYRGGKGSPGG